MVTKSSPDEGQLVPETVVQQSILQQAQAAAAAQTDVTNPPRQEALLEKTDLVTPDLNEGDIPPPAYGEIYDEIRNEKSGLGTSARVTDDGRVNIRINQLNRRLSQIFTPALHQQLQNVQDSASYPPSSIPPLLGGNKGENPPPPLNVVIQVVGSRGDVQPFIALGIVLKNTYGHRVRLATHPTFKHFVQDNGLEFFSIGADPARLMAFMVKNPSLVPGFRTLLSGDIGQRRKDVAEYIQGCWRSCYQAGDGMRLRAADDNTSESSGSDNGAESAAKPFVADCIIANPPSLAHIHCAEKMGIPLHIMFTMPYSPTQVFPHPLANIQSSNADPQLTNYISYAMIDILLWQGLGDIMNRFRVKCLGLDPISTIWAPGMLERLKIPHTYCWSPALIPKPKDWGPHISISGFYFLNLASDYTPASDLQAFLDAGPPPVYIGFGSIVLDDPDGMTELIFEAARKTGQRVLLSKGWGGMGAKELRTQRDVFMLGNVPHDWLFKHVSCVVHHGGAGTTAAGITAGRPTVIVPFFGDQPFWGAMVARAGAGPDAIPHKQLTADNLADAINFCLRPDSLERAKELASKIASERGSDVGAQSFHQNLEVDRLRCALAPSRSAVWRIKRTQIKLSAFAACTLANANLLDFHDLKLFRPQEYQTDEGPWDPISGFTASLFGALGNMAMGVADFPSETYKAVQLAVGSSRQQSGKSIPTAVTKSETSPVVGEGSNSPTSPGQEEMRSDMQKIPSRMRNRPKFFKSSSSTSSIGSSSSSTILQGQLNSRQDGASQNRFRSSKNPGLDKDYDMMRHTSAHTTKGIGRIVKAAMESPVELSMSITKGFHNAPKLWGDDTVRPQEPVNDMKSSAIAMGKEFGFGMYDGVTGLVTQPWKGARKDGTTGFFKGLGKGIGGFVAKPGAALWCIPSYMMKGVHKEVQKLFGNNVQNYIVASRTAQGYEEWLQSSDAEKQGVIARWKLIEIHLKKKRKLDEDMVRDILEAQKTMNIEDAEFLEEGQGISSSAQSAVIDDLIPDIENTALAVSVSQSLGQSTEVTRIDEAFQLPSQSWPHEGTGNNNMERPVQNTLVQTQYQRQEDGTDQENLRHAIVASEIEAQRQLNEALKYEQQLKQVMAQSLKEHKQRSPDDQYNDGLEQVIRDFGVVADTLKIAAVAGGSSSDRGHLEGTTRSEFEEQRGEKTTQERTEEEIVMEYVKKQSLLEMQHQNKGKAHASAVEERG